MMPWALRKDTPNYNKFDLGPSRDCSGTPEVSKTSSRHHWGVKNATESCSRETSKHPDIQISRHPDIQTSRHPDIQTSRHQDIQTSRQPDIQTCRQPNIQTARHPDMQTPVHPDIQTTRHPDTHQSPVTSHR